MSIEARPLTAITRHALELLSKEIGIVDTVRFLNQFSPGYGDYTKERDDLFKDIGIDEIVRDMKKFQGEKLQ